MFFKKAINQVETNAPQFYRHETLYKWAKEADEKGESYFYCHNTPEGYFRDIPGAHLIKDDGPIYEYHFYSCGGVTKDELQFLLDNFDTLHVENAMISLHVSAEDYEKVTEKK